MRRQTCKVECQMVMKTDWSYGAARQRTPNIASKPTEDNKIQGRIPL